MSDHDNRSDSRTSTADPPAIPHHFRRRLEPGGLVVRFFARLIDGIIVGIVSLVLFFVTDTLSNYWVTGLFTGLLTFIYFLAFEISQGWTPGKKLLGLRVHGPGGAAKPTAAAVRDPQRVDAFADHPVHRRPAGRSSPSS